MAIARQSSARNVGRFWHVFLIASQHRAPQNNPIIWDLANSVAIRFFQRNQDISEYDYLFTLKNAHLSSNIYNFWMQQNIAMKFAEHMAWILLYKHCKFGGNIYYASRDIKFFLWDYYFLVRPVYATGSHYTSVAAQTARSLCKFWYALFRDYRHTRASRLLESESVNSI